MSEIASALSPRRKSSGVGRNNSGVNSGACVARRPTAGPRSQIQRGPGVGPTAKGEANAGGRAQEDGTLRHHYIFLATASRKVCITSCTSSRDSVVGELKGNAEGEDKEDAAVVKVGAAALPPMFWETSVCPQSMNVRPRTYPWLLFQCTR